MTTKKRRYLRPWIQRILELYIFINLGFLCSLNLNRIGLSTIILLSIVIGLLIRSALLLKRYGRYEDEV
ncbi:MAG: hypothetical protein IKO38_07295 [Erysipelotrichaceae bacterium]|nr:hypothetical protein [Erysipelotrichaceae bacterium]